MHVHLPFYLFVHNPLQYIETLTKLNINHITSPQKIARTWKNNKKL